MAGRQAGNAQRDLSGWDLTTRRESTPVRLFPLNASSQGYRIRGLSELAQPVRGWLSVRQSYGSRNTRISGSSAAE